MKRSLRWRFWIAVVAALSSAASLVLTLLWRDWIEIIFHVDPDRGSGALEWLIVVALLSATVLFGTLARNEWRRASTAQTQT
jgi:hypothetical protein